MKTLAEIFEHTLQDIYYAENAITKALPKVAQKATDAKLKKAVEDHLAETKDQIKKLDQVFSSLGKKASGEKCDAIEGLIKEAEGLMEEASGTALNAGLLAACQAVEHYEISRYGSLREWAKDLGHDEAHKLLSEILDQEKATNNKLTNLAVTSINKTQSRLKLHSGKFAPSTRDYRGDTASRRRCHSDRASTSPAKVVNAVPTDPGSRST